MRSQENKSIMRYLMINNYFSPCRYGWGYRQLFEQATAGLHEMGHTVAVLTSSERHGPEIARPYPVHRLLTIEPNWEEKRSAPRQFFAGRRRREARAVADLTQLIDEFRPDAVFIWHAIGIPRAVLQAAETLLPGRVAYYFADYQPELKDEYMQYWQGRPANALARLIKTPIAHLALDMLAREGKPIPLRYEHAACVSGYVRDRLVAQNLITPNAVVIHNGVDLEQFAADGRSRFTDPQQPVRCLIGGRLVPEKGVHTVVDGFGRLTTQMPHHNLQLTILGDGPDAYVQLLKQKIAQHGIEHQVTFQRPVPYRDMPEKLSAHDVLILASEYDEPLARAMQEGMAMGLLVVGTTTGGSGELLVHDETGLVFDAGDSQSLATQFARIVENPKLAACLTQAGYQSIQEHFNMGRMIDELDDFLAQIVTQQTERV